MNRQDVKQAYMNGKQIQARYKNHKKWVDLKRPAFKDGVEYRVKHEADDKQLYTAMLFTALGFLLGAFLAELF
jgi:hypothetical protein